MTTIDLGMPAEGPIADAIASSLETQGEKQTALKAKEQPVQTIELTPEGLAAHGIPNFDPDNPEPEYWADIRALVQTVLYPPSPTPTPAP